MDSDVLDIDALITMFSSYCRFGLGWIQVYLMKMQALKGFPQILSLVDSLDRPNLYQHMLP